jgi:hypothetical protein
MYLVTDTVRCRISPRMPLFATSASNVGFIVGKKHWNWGFSKLFCFPCQYLSTSASLSFPINQVGPLGAMPETCTKEQRYSSMHSYFNFALHVCEWSTSCTGRLMTGVDPSTYGTWSWQGPRDIAAVQKRKASCTCWERNTFPLQSNPLPSDHWAIPATTTHN